MKAPVQQLLKGAIVELWLPGKLRPSSVIDFHSAGLSMVVAKAFARAFVSLHGALTLESQRAAWILIRRFIKYVSERFGGTECLPKDCLSGYSDWLASQGLSQKSIVAAQNKAIQTIQWCLRNAIGVVSNRIDIQRLPRSYSSRSETECQVGLLNEEDIKRILAACYRDIEQTEARLSGQNDDDQEAGEISKIIKQLLVIGGGQMPLQKTLRKARGGHALLAKVQAHGGLRRMQAKFGLSIEDLFPFYLAILIQSSGNPMSVLEMQSNCIIQVPLRPELERLVWEKRRSSQEQAPEFSRGKTWAAPNIARKLMALNKDLRKLAKPGVADDLFLCWAKAGLVTRPSWQSIHNYLAHFIKRHGLPSFNLRDFRKAGARLHHHVARSQVAAKKRLQHVEISTTERYSPISTLTSQHEQVILRFQGQILSSAGASPIQDAVVKRTEVNQQASATVFGFGCKDPYAGIAEGSHPGEVCRSFQQCASCAGSLVVVDDPIYVSRLVNAYEYLLKEQGRAIKEGWAARFESLYGATMTILKMDILPSISRSNLEKERNMTSPPIPRLE